MLFARLWPARTSRASRVSPGVGRKTAERLVVEMRDHFKDAPTLAGVVVALAPREEALHALLALGYKPPEAQRMLEKIATEGASTED